MNVFFLDKSPVIAALDQCDKHIVKMPLESAQMLCTVLDKLGMPGVPYKPTVGNFKWLCMHAKHLCNEYTYRYGKRHKSAKVIDMCSEKWGWLPGGDMTEPAICVPDKYIVAGDPVKSYRSYYIGDKSRFAVWKYGNEPEWWTK